MARFVADSAEVVDVVIAAIEREMKANGLVTVPADILTPDQLRQVRKLAVKMVSG